MANRKPLMSPEEFAALITKCRIEQGLPEKVDDPVALQKIARLLSGSSDPLR